MRVLIDNSGYHLQNMGDVAMLEIAARRLREFVPEAQLQTITIAPHDLERLIGGWPLHANERKRWQSSRAIPVPVRRSWLSNSMRNRLDSTESRFKVRFPQIAARSIKLLGGRDAESNCQTSTFVDAVKASDLVVATGGGFFTDAFASHANDVMTTLELAQQLKKPTIVFGQGIGPLICKPTLRRMARALGRANRIGLREQKCGRQILSNVGIPDSKVVCTGDDAIELAHSKRPSSLGNAVGVNLRVANYSGVRESQVSLLRAGLVKFCTDRKLLSLPVPISFFGGERDLDRVNELMKNVTAYTPIDVEQTPTAVIETVARCRIVVTGSYHAGVFALSQGIPVIGLAASPYYQSKFLGLIDQFGKGCQLIDLSTNFAAQFDEALKLSYENASAWRPALLRAAERQIKLSRAFYEESLSAIVHRHTHVSGV